MKNLENALDTLEVHVPAAKLKLQAIQAKYETGQQKQKISEEDNKVCILILYIITREHFGFKLTY